MIINIDTVPVCLINLPERTERLTRTEEELYKFYSNPIYGFNYNLIPGVIDKFPHIGIATAHMNAIQLAKDNNWEYVMVCEDDIHVNSTKSKEYAIEAFKQAPDDFDILLSAIYSNSRIKPYNQYWNRVGEFCGTHFYLVHNKAYDKILSFDKSTHIDRWLGRIQQGLNCYVSNKYYMIQHSGWSDNVNKEMDYTNYLNQSKVLK